MNDMQVIARAQCGKGFASAMEHAGKAIDGVFHGAIWLVIWALVSAANGLKLAEEAVSDKPRQMTLDEVA